MDMATRRLETAFVAPVSVNSFTRSFGTNMSGQRQAADP